MSRIALLAALCLLVSCGAPVAMGSGGTPAATATPVPPRPARQAASPIATPERATAVLATPVTATPIGVSAAPSLTLEYGGETRSVRPFTVVWSDERGSIIADGAPIISQMEVLSIPAGTALNFLATGMTRPTRAAVRVYEVVGGDFQRGSPEPVSLPTRIAEQGATTEAALVPGEYLLVVDLRWGRNEASYGFRVRVTP
jgi:hypothetical protein